MTAESWDVIKTALTVVGGVVAALVTGRLTRTSQKESAQIHALTNLIDQLQEERNVAVKAAKQIPLWRRYAQKLRSQIYGLGGTPKDAEHDLEL
ncbi:hypothetical protein [Arthrobacter sp. NA-172]|uniref:hypothetical protein n=1 Tax=Arthrobacter sp. NA-172 TaxID=3367524 RepID=UPI00375400BC